MAFDDASHSLKRIHTALYGAPLNPADLEFQLAQHGLNFPLWVTVVSDGSMSPAAAGVWCFNPNDGLLYLTANATFSRSYNSLNWLDAHTPQAWLRSMQRSILALRHGPRSRPGSSLLTADAEQRARQQALRQVYTMSPDWESAVSAWCQSVFAVTQTKIHDSQRHLVDFATQAARSLCSLGSSAWRFHFVLQQMLTAYTWPTLQSLLLSALEIVQEQQRVQSTHLDSRIQRCLRYIKHNFDTPLTLETLAKIAQMAPATLSRSFKQATGCHFTRYLQERRLEHSVELLLQSDRTVLDIAISSGFGSIEQYHRVFKQAFGTTPGRFRRYQKSQQNIPIGPHTLDS